MSLPPRVQAGRAPSGLTALFRMGSRPAVPCIPPALPPGWVEAEDEEGKTFYYNEESGASQWEPPPVPMDMPAFA